jgi:hypothetical protein
MDAMLRQFRRKALNPERNVYILCVCVCVFVSVFRVPER